MQTVLQIIIAGLTAGAIYALIALSFNVIYGATGILNFAQGDLVMVGTMVGAGLYGQTGWPVVPALLAVVALGAVLGALEERIAVRPARKRGSSALGWIVATLGFAIVLRAAVSVIMGPDSRPFPDIVKGAPHHIGGAVFNNEQILLVALAVVITVVLHQIYRRTRLGWALTAIAHDSEAAAIRGIPIARLSLLTFAVGGGLAAGTGFVAAPIIGAAPSIGFGYALSGFIAAAAGGIPDIRGALLGGMALGLIEALGTHYMGAGYQEVVVFAVLIVILAIRPAGLFGRTAVRTV